MRPNLLLLPTLLTSCFITYPGTPDDDDELDGGSPADSGPQCSGGGSLGDPLTEAQIGALPPCCADQGGAAHCYAPPMMPDGLVEHLATCPSGGYCMPDAWLRTGGAEPTRCTAGDREGRCLSVCLPETDEPELLPYDCGPQAVCVPCIDPRDDMPTGACDDDWNGDDMCNMGPDGGMPDFGSCDDPLTCPYDSDCPPCIPPEQLVPCAPDAHCYPRDTLVEDYPDFADDLAECPDSVDTLCVPDKILVTCGKFIPQSCRSTNDSEGRCQSKALPDVGDNDRLPQDVCSEHERCVPCFSPFDGSDTGACTTECDSPLEAARIYPKCCDGIGSCIEKEKFTKDEAKPLEEMECEDYEEDRYWCFPDDLGMNRPGMPCTADPFLAPEYHGVCFPCMDAPDGDCPAGMACLPCLDGLDEGEPTGLPGCPEMPSP